MSEGFFGEIRLMGFGWAPRGWAPCNGQTLQIAHYQALFAVIGTLYGGNGETTFQLPDLRGRVPIHLGAGHVMGDSGGSATHELTTSEMPSHRHPLKGTAEPGSSIIPTQGFLADTPSLAYHASDDVLVPLAPGSVSDIGGNAGHENMQPFTALTFCICVDGVYPPHVVGDEEASA